MVRHMLSALKVLICRVAVSDPHGSALFLEAESGSALKSKLRSFRGSKEPWKAVDAHNGGLELKNGAPWGLWSRHSMRRRIRIRITVKSWIRIRIRTKVKSWSYADPH